MWRRVGARGKTPTPGKPRRMFLRVRRSHGWSAALFREPLHSCASVAYGSSGRPSGRRLPSHPLQVLSPLARFLRSEVGGGVLLVAATVAAVVWANSPWGDAYRDLWHRSPTIGWGWWAVREDLRHWVNDALMVVSFFLIGLEIRAWPYPR